ncbi:MULTISPECIES: hypothetical protein [unclassified Microcoleus]|uniref:hypothetical protein n=1 Tax=unclassified Microcoleus TaxID=2642155 RepID=UPI002FCF92F6
MQIVWTKHAQERQLQWEERLKITREEVEVAVINPQQIIVEDDVLVAQIKRGNGLLRVPFVEIGKTRRILTLYWTNQVKRYWQENTDES